MTDPLAFDDGFDPDERALCPDDACIGVLDGTGHCKICGRQGTAAPAAAPASQSSPELAGLPGAEPGPADPALGTAAEGPSADAAAAAAARTDADSDDFADRRLCADPGCIGVLTATGRCKECGRTADPAP